MEKLFNNLGISEVKYDPIHPLRGLKDEALRWLRARTGPVDATDLFVVLMSSPYIAGFPNHGRDVVIGERLLASAFSSGSETSPPYPLPADKGSCICAALHDLSVDKIYLSGSVREGSQVCLWSEVSSDVDAMFRLEPVTVLDTGTSSSASGDAGVLLTMEPTRNPGYVLLKHVPGSSCGHPDALTFSGDRAVKLLGKFHKIMDEDTAPRQSGPALNASIQDFLQHTTTIDLVPCLEMKEWPFAEFATRPRPSGQPAEGLVHQLCGVSAFLVPVGFPDSDTERDEWRVSFSRQEYILFRAMSESQRSCLTILNSCKAILILSHLKSYHLKTALMWLCETRERSQWSPEGMQDSLLLILTYLEACVEQRSLPCYFCPEINVFATRDDHQMAELAVDIQTLKDSVFSCSLALVAYSLDARVDTVASRLLCPEAVTHDAASQTVRLLTDTVIEDLKHGRFKVWSILRGVFTCSLEPGFRRMPCWSSLLLVLRPLMASLEKYLAPEGGFGEFLSVIVSLLHTFQKALDGNQHMYQSSGDADDSWMSGV